MKLNCREVVNFTLTTMVSFHFLQNQVATKMAKISSSQKKKKKKKKLAAKLTCFTVSERSGCLIWIIWYLNWGMNFLDLYGIFLYQKRTHSCFVCLFVCFIYIPSV